MERRKNRRLLPFIMVILMLASSFAVIGAVSGAETSTQTRAYGDAGKILYIYGDNKTIANEWREYLTDKNYTVDMLPVNGVSNANYYRYNLIMIGTDATGISTEEIKHMYLSDIPILGIGVGGGRLLPIMGLTTYLYSSTSGTDTVDALNVSIYQTPNSISGAPGEIQIYNHIASNIYVMKKSERNLNDTLFIGNWTPNKAYATIAQVNHYMFYGYTQSPKEITANGDGILENIIYYMDKNHGYNIRIPRMLSRINMDGKYSYLFEWYGANFIRLEDTWNNYTAIFEDESYIYLYLQVVNTSDSDYLSVHFESNNSRSVSLQDSTFYVVLSEGGGGVFYREADSSGSWTSFKNPDGVNITAYWNFSSQYCTAEVKILKSYMGLSKNGDNILGFGMQYTNVVSYPSTFRFNEPNTYITAYSQTHWNGQYEEIRTPASYIHPVIDGSFSSSEWNGASQYYLQDESGHGVLVRSLEDGSYLYLGGYISNVSNKESTIRFYFDPNGNGGSAPQTDDVRFSGSKLDNDTFSYTENHGTGSGWSPDKSATNATIKMTMNGNYVYYEMKIPFNVIGITSGTFKDVHMRVHTYIDGSSYTVPYLSYYLKPDEWTLLLTSPAAWGNNYMTFNAHNGTAVTLDGVKSAGEWDDAFLYSYPVSNTPNKNIDMYMKTSGNKLYILAHYSNPTPSNYTNIQLGFDVDYDHNGPLKSGDFAIKIAFNGEINEWRVSGGNWVYTTPSGWSFAMDNSSSSWTIEIAIDYSKLNITMGNAKDIGVITYINDDGAGAQNEPTSGSWFDISTWNRITSSDNWGESTEVPEFSDGILAMMLIVVFAAVAVAARKRR